jgi:hypothetical protein
VPEEQNTTHALLLNAAKVAKQDEYYTQWADIEREMNAYLEYEPNVFRDKVILLPCDDPEWSNFTKFFALHFADFGIKKLISTSYAADSNPAGEFYRPTLFETTDPKYDEAKTRANGKKFVLEAKDLNGDGTVDIDDLQWEYLDGGGDFRSSEVTALRDEADMVITNPPFSLFRPFVVWLMDGGTKFAIIGNQNAVTYQSVFPLFKENRLWLGKGFPRNIAHFRTPYTPHGRWIEQDDPDVVRIPGIQWFTNIDHGRRHEPLQLMTMADNLRFNKKLIKALDGATTYQHYDNYDAIDVPFTDAIPSDYDGVMGVPITFLGKYNPDQFEILGTLESSDPNNPYRTRWYSSEDQKNAYFRRFGKPGTIPLNMSGVINDVKVYKRILIRHKGTS